jgi:Beta-lactamase
MGGWELSRHVQWVAGPARAARRQGHRRGCGGEPWHRGAHDRGRRGDVGRWCAPARRRDHAPAVDDKAVTTVAALGLVAAGRLGLDEPVERWLPELADRQVLRRPSADLADPSAAVRAITLRQLLTNTCGYGMVLTACPLQRAMADSEADPDLHRCRDLMGAAARTMGPVGQALQTARLIATKPAVQALAGDAPPFGHLGHRPPITQHFHDGVIALLDHSVLPEHPPGPPRHGRAQRPPRGRPSGVSRINRSRTPRRQKPSDDKALTRGRRAARRRKEVKGELPGQRWGDRRDLNPRPSGPQPDALTN